MKSRKCLRYDFQTSFYKFPLMTKGLNENHKLKEKGNDKNKIEESD